MEGTVHLIRHGTTEGNLNRWYYGAMDLPLAQVGIEEIAGLVDLDIYPRPEKGQYYTSGLKRANQTFQIIYGDIERTTLSGFREMEFGVFEGRTHDQLVDDPEYIKWIEDETRTMEIPNGESPVGFHNRVVAAMEQFIEEKKDYSGESVILCHGGTIATIMNFYFKGQREHFYKWIPDTGRGFTVKIQNLKPVSYEEI